MAKSARSPNRVDDEDILPILQRHREQICRLNGELERLQALAGRGPIAELAELLERLARALDNGPIGFARALEDGEAEAIANRARRIREDLR